MRLSKLVNRPPASSGCTLQHSDLYFMLDRQKRKNEALANEILGKNRRASAPGAGVVSKKQTAAAGSLASRIGVVKVRKLVDE